MPLASPRPGFRRSAAALLVLAAMACADDTAATPAARSEASETTDSGAPPDSWDATPPTEAGTVVTFGVSCALLSGVMDLSWALVDPEAHEWTRTGEPPAEPDIVDWLPFECYPHQDGSARLLWAEDGEIEWSTIHRVSPATAVDTWLGVLAITRTDLPESCLSILEEHDASSPTLRLTRITTEAP